MGKTVIIGGGIAGLTAAYYLQQARKPFVLLETSDRVGGRVRTDDVEGFRLDRGFQVFLTAYPEAEAILDYGALDLRAFRPGAVILQPHGKRSRIGDALRDPACLWDTVTSSAATLSDKVKILRLKRQLRRASVDDIFARTETSTARALSEAYGFSDTIIRQFFEPFYRGIFLEEDLLTSRRMFDFVFKMFSQGDAAVPALGIEAIPQQLVSHLAGPDVICGDPVLGIEAGTVICASGRHYEASHIIIATDAVSAAGLLGRSVSTAYRGTTTMYFATSKADLAQRYITLLPEGMVNNICDMTSVSPSLAPAGQRLLCVTLRERARATATPEAVQEEMQAWYPSAYQWRHLQTYEIPYALPDQTHVQQDGIEHHDGLIIIGDHLLNGSVNAAMRSGRLAAETILAS